MSKSFERRLAEAEAKCGIVREGEVEPPPRPTRKPARRLAKKRGFADIRAAVER
jgi:hypothetical protein